MSLGSPNSAIVWMTGITLLAGSACDERSNRERQAASDRNVRVAAASDLKFALDELIPAFHAGNPTITVSATYGSSGGLYAQLSNKAPFDVFLSADIEYPRKLVAAGLALEDSLFEYAAGHIVVWVPGGSPINVQKLGIEALTDPFVKKIAVANPAHAPYGRAADAAMKSLGVYDRVRERIVMGENIAQSAQFVESGAADVGIIALSIALAPAMRDKGESWTVPLDAYPRLRQGGAILSRADDRQAARRFCTFMTGPEGSAVLEEYGFALPEK